MKSHTIDSDLSTFELVFDGKTYNVEASLNVLDKIENFSDDISDISRVKKIIGWLVNDAIERENLRAGSQEKGIPMEHFGLLIGRSNLPYYSEIISKVIAEDDLDDAETDDDGNIVIVPNEMKEEFGEVPVKNEITE